MPKRYDSTVDYEPKDTDRVCDFLDMDASWPLEPSSILQKFAKKLDTIYYAGQAKGLCNGEILLMINKNFGYFKRDVPWGRIDEIREWIINNWFRNYQILEPKRHDILMQTENPYSVDFKKHEKEVRTEW